MIRWGRPDEPRPGAPYAAATFIIALWVIGGTLVGEPSLIATTDTLPPAVYVVAPDVTEAVPASSPDVSAPGLASPGDAPASVTQTADRADSFLPVGPVSTPPTPTPGDCDAWLDVFAYYGATADELVWWEPILWRESRCGSDTLNESSGDSGICQINPIHNRAGWFGGVEWGDGGWLLALHGLRTRYDTDSIVWADACVTLRQVCGTGPWQPPYSCANRRLP